jgi:hypothetical protein
VLCAMCFLTMISSIHVVLMKCRRCAKQIDLLRRIVYKLLLWPRLRGNC